MIALLLAAALAATPNPDRPSVSRSGALVAPNTVELELGTQWYAGRSAPATLKYSIDGVVEPRLSVNLGGFGPGTPGLEAGAKIRLLEKDRAAVCLWAGSAIPVDPAEAWYAQIHGLYSQGFSDLVSLTVNAGADLVGTGSGVGSGGLPIVTAVGLAPGRFSLFGELAGRIGGPGCTGASCGYGNLIVDGGLGFLLTESLILDTGAGWDLAADTPFATVGLTMNAGSPNP